jgi:hypothetical protein
MNVLLTIPFLLAGCLGADPDAPDEAEVESESVPMLPQGAVGQGSTMQGSTMQGSTMQGSTMQGSTMQGSTMQGSTYGGLKASYGSVVGTALVFWTKASKVKGGWEQRFPDKICYWNSTRTLVSSCTKYAVGVPIVGATFPTTFQRKNPDGTTETIPVTLRLEAVHRDTTQAMFPLDGSDFATGVRTTCENPDRCRVNSDIFNYDLKAIDVVDANGQNPWLCPAGQTAIALAGTWNTDGSYAGGSQFTFACTNGVIAKCTRWGYRPYDRAIKDNTTGPAISLAPYHQACVRAAMADYCGNGKSMTKDGTLIDIYDYTASYQTGFIPKTRGFVYPIWETASAFAWEAVYSTRGAERIDALRYAELATNPDWSVWTACPGTFWDSSSGENFANYIRHGETPSPGVDVYVDSVPACGHSEYTVGKWLHSDCTYCAGKMPAYCNDPADPRGWDQGCVDYVKANDDQPWHVCYGADNVMSTHSECTTGAALGKYDTGCTIAVCASNSSCCSPSGTWSQACVDAANTTCKGGRESGIRGFCGYFPGAGGGGGGIGGINGINGVTF